MIRSVLLLTSVLLTGCTSRMQYVKVSPDGKGFALASSGGPFTPWGFNYDRDYRFRLIDEYWQTEWATIEEDFREMKQLGATVVRVHLQIGKFMDSADTVRPDALKHMVRLADLAESTGLYLDITGLGCYRKSNVPAWYDALSEKERWAVQGRFWSAIAEACADSPAIFCYDLMNEPIVPGGQRKAGEWMAGELEGLSYVQFITLDQANRPRNQIAKDWVSMLAAAIRVHDSRHLITVGLLPNSYAGPGFTSGFVPQELIGPLDFICVHIYPKPIKHSKVAGIFSQTRPADPDFSEDIKTLERFVTGKPVVIEEIFPLNCSSKELVQFINQTRSLVAGNISFYWGQTPAELKAANKLTEAVILDWLEKFQTTRPGATDFSAGTSR